MNLKKKESYIRVSGGRLVTKLELERKARPQFHVRDESEISHKAAKGKAEATNLGSF